MPGVIDAMPSPLASPVALGGPTVKIGVVVLATVPDETSVCAVARRSTVNDTEPVSAVLDAETATASASLVVALVAWSPFDAVRPLAASFTARTRELRVW